MSPLSCIASPCRTLSSTEVSCYRESLSLAGGPTGGFGSAAAANPSWTAKLLQLGVDRLRIRELAQFDPHLVEFIRLKLVELALPIGDFSKHSCAFHADARLCTKTRVFHCLFVQGETLHKKPG
jgi:hypothetical protein